MFPAVGTSKPASISRQVVFPEPDGPSRVRNSPFSIARLKSFTTSVSPSYDFCTLSNSTKFLFLAFVLSAFVFSIYCVLPICIIAY